MAETAAVALYWTIAVQIIGAVFTAGVLWAILKEVRKEVGWIRDNMVTKGEFERERHYIETNRERMDREISGVRAGLARVSER